MSNWSDEETGDPTHADRRNFYKVEKWSRAVRLASPDDAVVQLRDPPAAFQRRR
jgi:hypothetical protein